MDLINPIVRQWLERAKADPEAFWADAAEQLPWFRKWDRVFEWNYPNFRWFLNAETNLAYNCLDHHVAQGWGGHAAMIYANERLERRVFTYTQLTREVSRLAAALRGLGIGKGDRITIYMPTCPEAIMLMLAAVRIGAIHSVVFAGFGAGALAERVRASGSRLLFTTDITFRKGNDVPLKGIVDAAMQAGGDNVEHVVVLHRGDRSQAPASDRDLDWDDFLQRGEGHDGGHVAMESNEPAYILATSGTTAKPKLAVSVHGGYQVHVHSMGNWCFGMKPTDVWWSTSDIGWVVGHSYIVYAPLLRGCTTIVYEGRAGPPQPGGPVADHGGVRRHRRVHLAHRGAPAHALRQRARQTLRPVAAGARLLRRRGAQRAGVGMAAKGRPGRPHTGDGPHVADRNRRPGVRQPVRPGDAAHQARLVGHPHAGRRSGGHDPRGRAVRAGRERHHGHQASLPRPHPDAVGRAGALRHRLLGAHFWGLLHRRLGPH